MPIADPVPGGGRYASDAVGSGKVLPQTQVGGKTGRMVCVGGRLRRSCGLIPPPVPGGGGGESERRERYRRFGTGSRWSPNERSRFLSLCTASRFDHAFRRQKHILPCTSQISYPFARSA